VDRRGVRAGPQTDRIFNTDRRVLFLRRLAYQNQPHSSTHAGFVDDIMAASVGRPSIKNAGQRDCGASLKPYQNVATMLQQREVHLGRHKPSQGDSGDNREPKCKGRVFEIAP
jgi:hypothetical protein